MPTAQGEDEDGELEDEIFQRELAAMAKYGSDEEADEGGAGGSAAGPSSFAALRSRLAAEGRLPTAGGGDEDEEDEDDAEEEGGEDLDPEVAAQARAEVQRLLEEYYRLDAEGHVGGMPTRFRYRAVPAEDFGLGVEEILRLEDRQLNQVVGLKALAPYR